MRHVAGMVLAVLMLSACGGEDEPKKPTVVDPFGFEVSGAEVVLPAFGVVIDGAAGSIGVGTELALSGRTSGTEAGGESYSWTLPAGAEVVSGGLDQAELVVRFTAPGDHLIELAISRGGATHDGGVMVTVVPAGPASALGCLSGGAHPTQADADLLATLLHGETVLSAQQRRIADLNLDGRLGSDDLALLQSAVDAGADAPVHLSSQRGAALSSLMVIHPALLDASAALSIELNSATAGSYDASCQAAMAGKPRVDTIQWRRTRPGYAVFSLPIRYACLSSAETLRVELVAGSERWLISDSLVVEPLPQASAVAGSSVLEAMGRLRIALDAMPQALATYADEIDATAQEKAVLQGMMQATADEFGARYAEFYLAFQQLDEPTRAAWEQLALAQGLDEQLELLRALTPDQGFDPSAALPQALTAAEGESLIGVICSFNQVADISSKIADINDTIAAALEWLDWWPVNKAPVVGPVISFLSSLSSVVSVVTDIIATLADFVPGFGDTVQIRATPSALTLGQSATLSAHLEIRIATGLCDLAGGSLVGSIIDGIKNQLANRLASMIPAANRAFRQARYQRDRMGRVIGTVYDAISYLAGEIVDASGLEGYLNNLASRVCALLEDPTIPVELNAIQATCGSVSGNVWTCTQSCGGTPPASIGLSGEKQVCDETKPASGGLTCMGEPPPVCGDGEIEAPEQCEGGNGCAAPQVCNPKCQCVDTLVCGNGIKEAGEECEEDADCGPAKACGVTSCTCMDVACTDDNQCPDADPNDCSVPACLPTGLCGMQNAGYGQPCQSTACRENETCDVDGVCKFGNDKLCNNPPGMPACYQAATCNPDNGVCDYALKPGANCGKDSDCASGTCDPGSCTCTGGGGTCGCDCDGNHNCTPNPAGTTFTPVSGCTGWPDADQCSGWYSVVEVSGQSPTGQFADGTEFGAYDCTIRINCP